MNALKREDSPPVGAFLDYELVDFNHQVRIKMEWLSYRMGVVYFCGGSDSLRASLLIDSKILIIKHFWRHIGAA